MSIPASEHSLNFVLVHGAWHGGWCWKRVSPLAQGIGAPGLHAYANRTWRAPAPDEPRGRIGYPHQGRCSECSSTKICTTSFWLATAMREW